MPKLVAYTIDAHAIDIRPAPLERDWMDTSDRRFAYRCLPLNIANAHGWELLCLRASRRGGTGSITRKQFGSSPISARMRRRRAISDTVF